MVSTIGFLYNDMDVDVYMGRMICLGCGDEMILLIVLGVDQRLVQGWCSDGAVMVQ